MAVSMRSVCNRPNELALKEVELPGSGAVPALDMVQWLGKLAYLLTVDPSVAARQCTGLQSRRQRAAERDRVEEH